MTWLAAELLNLVSCLPISESHDDCPHLVSCLQLLSWHAAISHLDVKQKLKKKRLEFKNEERESAVVELVERDARVAPQAGGGGGSSSYKPSPSKISLSSM